MFIRAKSLITFAQILKSNNNNGFNTRFLFLYSSSASPNSPLQDHLISSLGFSSQEALTTSSKVTSRWKNPKNPYLVIELLKKTGLDQTQMKDLIFKVPELLSHRVNKTLKPKFLWFQEMGFSVSDMVGIILKDTSLLARSLDKQLRPRFDFVRTLLGSDENVLKILKRYPWLLSYGKKEVLVANIKVLRDFGLSDDRIQKLVFKGAGLIIQKPDKVREVLHIVEKDFGVPRGSMMFVYAADVVFSVKRSSLEARFGIFKSFGWSDSEVLEVFRKMPCIFRLSGAKLERGLSFFMKELGCEPASLATNAVVLGYSLDKRVKPRYEVFKILDREKLDSKRNWNIISAVKLSDSKFIEYFLLPYYGKLLNYESLKKSVLQ